MEFKHCGGGISADKYEYICSFLNRYGGDIYLGVEDDDTVRVSQGMLCSTSSKWLAILKLEYKGKNIVHIHVLASSEVHNCKKSYI